jgi:hypothetical protein
MVTKRSALLMCKALISLVVCILAGIGVASIVRAQQQGTARSATLMPADRLEIQELLHRYMFILDSCPDHNNGYEYADLYTEDGQFSSQDIQFGMTVKGRDALAQVAGRTSDGNCSPIRHRGAINQIHLNVAPIIEPAPEGARGISYLMMIDGPAHEMYWNGWYHDVYAKTPQGWRFRSRLHVGGGAVGVPAELSAARGLWEREPTPAGSRSLVGKAQARPEPLAPDPLNWLTNGRPSGAAR